MTRKATLLSMIVLGVLGTVTLVAWAGEQGERKLKIDQVPAAVKATIVKAADGASITEIEEVTKDGVTFYEAEFKRDGKEVEVRVAADGKLLGQKTGDEDDDEGDDDDLSLADIPAPARAALLQLAGNAQITEVERDTEDGVVVYEAKWTQNEMRHEAAVMADGTLVETEELVAAPDVPAAVRTVITERFGADAKVKVARKTIVVYEVETRVDGREVELVILPTGRVHKGADADDDDGHDDDDHNGDEDDD